jgi:hypothetical protein
MKTLENLQTLPDLLKLISKQKTMTDKTVRELHREMDQTHLLFRPDRTLTDGSSQEITRRVHAMLFKYASLPTLTEFDKNPKGELNGFQWGASFGVSAIIGSVFLNSWCEIFPEFKNIVRAVLMRVLEEQINAETEEEPNPTPMIERILPAMKFSIRDQSGVEIIGEQRNKIMYARVAALLQLMAQVLVNYGVLELDESEMELEEGQINAKLSPLGRRVYLHLRDVEVYVGQISVIYPKLKDKVVLAG